MERPLSVAILALGGQGGGVLAGWIVAAAEASGWHAQSTSVPGVAQRTGATLYYVEMLPPRGNEAPVFALMPTPGDVDIVIAAELMEAGRAVLRGLATPERTLLIASTHRVYAVAETEKPGDAIGNPEAVSAALRVSARRIIAFDFDRAAREADTVISSPLFGALAGSGALPFKREAFERAIASGGKGVSSSLEGFASGFLRANVGMLPDRNSAPHKSFAPLLENVPHRVLNELVVGVRAFPAVLHGIVFAGLRRAVSYQDAAYGDEYLGRLRALHALDEKAGGAARGYAFTAAAAKHLANALAYDDVIGVADAKTRPARFARVIGEIGVRDGEPLHLTEFMHPRAEELVGLLPARIGRRVAQDPAWMRLIDRLFNRRRLVKTTAVGGFLRLYLISGLRPLRRRLWRHAEEMAQVRRWLTLAEKHIATNYGLAEGIIAARRLVKGYSGTHARGLSKFDRVLSAVPLLAQREDAGAWMHRLIAAALKDEDGEMLDGALRTIGSLQDRSAGIAQADVAQHLV
jgi:indolepyruvate ferredoxin oxidoreductase beta subunit